MLSRRNVTKAFLGAFYGSAASLISDAHAKARASIQSNHRLVLQVLGSGGPMHGQARGSSAYVLWRHGYPAIVIDMGGDTATALSRAGVEPGQINLMLLSHLHPDHVSGIPDFFWGELTAQRKTPLKVVGPRAGERFLETSTFLRRLFGPDGAYPDLQALFDGSAFPLEIEDLPTDGMAHDVDGLRVEAHYVPHGRAPTLAFRLECDGSTIVLGGDQTAKDSTFPKFATKADLLVMHAIVNDNARGNPLEQVVALPDDIGLMATAAGARKLLLSHFMSGPATAPDANQWSLAALNDVKSKIQQRYRGPIVWAKDLDKIVIA